jgi:hypothetical protein
MSKAHVKQEEAEAFLPADCIMLGLGCRYLLLPENQDLEQSQAMHSKQAATRVLAEHVQTCLEMPLVTLRLR